MATVAEIMEEITRSSSLKEEITLALKAGRVEALRSLIDHPLANLVLAALEGWTDADE